MRGDRVVTFLLSLNEAIDGGDTQFCPRRLPLSRPWRATPIFFANLKGGEPDQMSLHSGRPVEAGEKYLLSQWIHDRPFTADAGINPAIPKS